MPAQEVHPATLPSFPRKRESILGGFRLATLLCMVLLLAGMILPVNAQEAAQPDDLALLKDSWERYKTRFIQDDGRVIDPNAKAISTSEGQSYALMRAVWIDDRQTFDRVYQWTRDNLQVRGDSLFAWKWGQQDGGAWTVLDSHTASDADQDIALALLMADKRWNHTPYRHDALAILEDMWEKETVETPYGRVLLPGDWPQERPEEELRLNPSYFAPYAYRTFARTARKHDWDSLVPSSYQVVHENLAETRSRLPSDWVRLYIAELARISRVFAYTDPRDTRGDFAYNAIRVFWRVALDELLNPPQKKMDVVSQALKDIDFLPRYYAVHGRFPGPLTVDGIERNPGELSSLAVYGATLPAVARYNPVMAEEILNRYVRPGLQSDTTDYYAHNWLWFGLALHYAQNHPPEGDTPLERLTRLLGE